MFALCYHIPGLTRADVSDMGTREREWWLRKLVKQRKFEADAQKRANKGG